MKGFLSFLKGTHTLTLWFLLLFLTPLGDNLPLCSRGSSRRLPASLGRRSYARTHGARPNGLEQTLRRADSSLSRPHALPCYGRSEQRAVLCGLEVQKWLWENSGL